MINQTRESFLNLISESVSNVCELAALKCQSVKIRVKGSSCLFLGCFGKQALREARTSHSFGVSGIEVKPSCVTAKQARNHKIPNARKKNSGESVMDR